MRRSVSDIRRNSEVKRSHFGNHNTRKRNASVPKALERTVTDFETEFLCDRTVEFMQSGDTRNIVAVELAEQSIYFERLLRYHQGNGVIYLPEFLNSQFSYIIEFIRTGKTTITENNVYDLFVAADFLLVTKLRNECTEELKKIVQNPSSAITLWVSARETYWPDVEKLAFNKILENFEKVWQTIEFLNLGVDDVKQILSNDGLNYISEKSVLDAAIQWIVFSTDIRRIQAADLLMCVRIQLLTTTEIEVMKTYEIIKSTPEILTIITTWPHCLNDASNLLISKNVKNLIEPRIPNEAVLVFGGWCNGEGPRAAAQVFDPRANRWTLWSENSTERNLLGEIPRRVYAGCVIVDKRVYIIGGFDGHNALKSTLSYDFEVDSGWYEISCMYEKRYYVSVAYALGFIYAIGGHNGENQGRLSSAERFNIEENLWNPIAPMNRVRSDAAAAELNDRVYVCGGFEGHRYHDSGEYYEPDTNQWTLISRMMSTRGGVTLVRHDNYLYAIGGNDGRNRLKTIERYDPLLCRWEIVGSMNRRKSNLSSTVINDDIYIIGGWSDEPDTGILDLVEKFDTKLRLCSIVQPLSFPASATCACTLRDKNVVMKYIRRKPADTSTTTQLVKELLKTGETSNAVGIQTTESVDVVPRAQNSRTLSTDDQPEMSSVPFVAPTSGISTSSAPPHPVRRQVSGAASILSEVLSRTRRRPSNRR